MKQIMSIVETSNDLSNVFINGIFETLTNNTQFLVFGFIIGITLLYII